MKKIAFMFFLFLVIPTIVFTKNTFHNCIGLVDASAIVDWNVSNVTDMRNTFNIDNNVPSAKKV